MTDLPNSLNSVTQMVTGIVTGNPGSNMATSGSMRDATAWREVKDAARNAWEHVRRQGAGGSGGGAETTVIRPR